jgi:dihydrofolate synthase/folylpolyglutamate synthase
MNSTSHSDSETADYLDALQKLLALEFFGMKLGLANMHALLDHLGHPEAKFATIHVAGTNGKGSVSATLAAIFQSSGKKAGLYTSPHLVDYRERIRINGVMIPESFVEYFVRANWNIITELKATFFEVTTALAFEYFASERVDIAIIETGLGGRLDATNVLTHPLATVVTSIGWDHMTQLGNTLEAIAFEKAGIFKPNVPAIVWEENSLRSIFEEQAKKVGAQLFFVPPERMDSLRDLEPSLIGAHQRQNLGTVLEVLNHLPDRPSDAAIRNGVTNVRELTGLRSRLEQYSHPLLTDRGLQLFLDVGHNLDALVAVREYFLAAGVRPIVVAGFMRDKDVMSVLNEIKKFADEFIAVEAPTSRALPSGELAALGTEAGLATQDGGEVMNGVRRAIASAKPNTTILLTGSHYVVGEFLANESGIGTVIPH